MIKYFIGWGIGLVNLAVTLHLDFKRHGGKVDDNEMRNAYLRAVAQSEHFEREVKHWKQVSKEWFEVSRSLENARLVIKDKENNDSKS